MDNMNQTNKTSVQVDVYSFLKKIQELFCKVEEAIMATKPMQLYLAGSKSVRTLSWSSIGFFGIALICLIVCFIIDTEDAFLYFFVSLVVLPLLAFFRPKMTRPTFCVIFFLFAFILVKEMDYMDDVELLYLPLWSYLIAAVLRFAAWTIGGTLEEKNGMVANVVVPQGNQNVQSEVNATPGSPNVQYAQVNPEKKMDPTVKVVLLVFGGIIACIIIYFVGWTLFVNRERRETDRRINTERERIQRDMDRLERTYRW